MIHQTRPEEGDADYHEKNEAPACDVSGNTDAILIAGLLPDDEP